MYLHFSPVEKIDLEASYALAEAAMKAALYKNLDPREIAMSADDFNYSIYPGSSVMLRTPTVQGKDVVFKAKRTLPLDTIVQIAAEHGLKVTVGPDNVSIP